MLQRAKLVLDPLLRFLCRECSPWHTLAWGLQFYVCPACTTAKLLTGRHDRAPPYHYAKKLRADLELRVSRCRGPSHMPQHGCVRCAHIRREIVFLSEAIYAHETKK